MYHELLQSLIVNYHLCGFDLPDTLERELRGLPEAAAFLGTTQATVVTLDEDKTIQRENCTIRLVPAWKWFLALENRASA